MSLAIEVQNLTFEYPSKRALHGVTFSIEPATVTALVGPNGAGKTTILRCLAALELPFSGTVKIDGLDTQDDPREIHRKVAYLPDFFGLYNALTVKQCLLHMASIHNIEKSRIKSVIEEIVEELQLAKILSSKAGNLSRGQRQRLAISQAIIHKPPVLLLDEPAAGLDPEARHSLSELITQLRNKNLTIVVSSHILSELEDYSTAMLTVSDGKILAYKKLSDPTIQPKKIIEVELLEAAADTNSLFQDFPSAVLTSTSSDKLIIELTGDKEAQFKLLNTLLAKGLRISSFSPRTESLQDVYLAQVKGQKKEG